MKRKVVHILSRARGGVHTFLRDLVLGTNEEYDITILVLGASDSLDVFERNHVKTICLNKTRFFTFQVLRSIFNIIRQHDVVHVHLFPTLYLCAFLRPLFLHKTFIFTEHASLNSRRNHTFLRFIEIPIYKLYSYVVAVSKSCKSNLDDWLLRTKKVEFIYNGIAYNKLPVIKPFDFRSYGINAKYVVTMVSRLSSDKDFDTLLKAFTYLDSDYHCVLVGDGELKHEIEQKISNYNLASHVSLLGYRSDVLSILSASSLSVLSSFGEGFSLTILESLAVNTLCIGSDVTGIRDILPPSLLFNPSDSQDLARKIKHYCTIVPNHTLCYNLLKPFSIDHTIASYKKLYNLI